MKWEISLLTAAADLWLLVTSRAMQGRTNWEGKNWPLGLTLGTFGFSLPGSVPVLSVSFASTEASFSHEQRRHPVLRALLWLEIFNDTSETGD